MYKRIASAWTQENQSGGWQIVLLIDGTTAYMNSCFPDKAIAEQWIRDNLRETPQPKLQRYYPPVNG